MSEIFSIDQITAEIILLKNQTAQNLIEIGKRLINAKQQLPHGEWENWLSKKVDINKRTAQKFMQLAKEYSNPHSIADLPQTKIFALLDLPSEQRQDFIDSNPVDEMTTREIKTAIKEKNDAIRRANDAEKDASLFKKQVEKLERQLSEKPKEVEKIVEKVVEKEVIPSDYSKLRLDLEESKSKYSRLLERNELLEESINGYERDSEEYRQLRSKIDNLLKEKDDLSRHIDSVSELSGLIFEIEHMLTRELAPIKYSRAMSMLTGNEIVKENLSSIVEMVKKWCNEMTELINDDTNFVYMIEDDFEDLED